MGESKNTHPAIIKQSDFDVVQKLLQYDGRASKTSDSASFLQDLSSAEIVEYR